MKLKKKTAGLVFAFFFTVLATNSVFAQIVINEFSSGTSDSDWIEIYNSSDSEVNLNGWSIDDTASSAVYEFSEALIPAHGYCVVDAGKSKNRLNNKGDRIQLLKEDSVIDCVSYGDGNGAFCKENKADTKAPLAGESASRLPNGIGEWRIAGPTKEYSNDDTLAPENTQKCLFITPSPTLSPSPAPTSTPTITSTPTPTNKPTLSPTPSEKPTSIPDKTSSPALVLADETSSPEPKPVNKEGSKVPVFAYVFVIIGIIFILVAGAPLVIKEYNKRKLHDEIPENTGSIF